jgi:MFS family permease
MEETAEKTAEKTSTWLALRNRVFRRLWLAMVVSGSCIGAHNTAIYWALHSLGGSTVLISLMATVSALPYTLFTLPAGALADMVDRKKILLAVQLWHAFLAIALAVLWMAHLLNPYLILASAFLFSAGFAFGSPAHSSVIAEIASAEELASAYTLAGLQMDVSGIIGPLLSALLLPLAGVSFIFGANGFGFILMFLAILQWKRPKVQSSLPLENFFESLTTAIRYVRYSPGIKILLARHSLFSFFISIIPSLMPVVGLKELHLEASELGYLFTSMAVGSVISGAFIIPWARARYSPQRITTFANLLLLLNCCLMVLVHRPFVFLVVAALAGMGWTLSASELWVASQRAMPDWARGRNAVKMAAVFMISTSTLAIRTRLTPRWIAFLGFAFALLLLFSGRYIGWILLVFPLWVLLISIYILIDNLRRPSQTTEDKPGTNKLLT